MTRRRRRNKWAGIIITILIPATPTILEPPFGDGYDPCADGACVIAPGCDQYGPTCVIDQVGDEPPPVTVITQEYPNPYPLLP